MKECISFILLGFRYNNHTIHAVVTYNMATYSKHNSINFRNISIYFMVYMWLDLQKHPKSHKNWNPIYCWKLKIQSFTTQNTKHINGQVYFHRWLFANPVKQPRCTTRCVEPMNDVNKDMSSARLLPMTVLTYPVDWVCFSHLLKTYVLMEGITCLWLPTPAPSCVPTHPL